MKAKIAALLRLYADDAARFAAAARGDIGVRDELRAEFDPDLLEHLKKLGAEHSPPLDGRVLRRILDAAWRGCLMSPQTVEQLRRNANQVDQKRIRTPLTILGAAINVSFDALVSAALGRP